MNLIQNNFQCITGACEGCAICALTSCAFRDLAAVDGHQRDLTLARGARLESRRTGACLQFWIIREGTAASCTAFKDGRRQIVGLEHSGDIICAAMAGTRTQNWLEALSECHICELDLTPFANDLRGNPHFLAATFAVIHRRLERSEAHISTLGRLDSSERVLLFLAEMAGWSSSALVTLPMSREDIADYLGLNSETVSRVLSKIKKSGLIRFLSPTEYIVPDMAKIARRLPVPIGSVPTGGSA